jgi:hypothetical protein
MIGGALAKMLCTPGQCCIQVTRCPLLFSRPTVHTLASRLQTLPSTLAWLTNSISTTRLHYNNNPIKMAPRRGGGGSSSSVSACPGAFYTTIEQASFALDVVFTVIYIGILIAFFLIRKKSSVAGKRIIGLPFIGAVFFFFL